jgi:hypothetical protein
MPYFRGKTSRKETAWGNFGVDKWIILKLILNE